MSVSVAADANLVVFELLQAGQLVRQPESLPRLTQVSHVSEISIYGTDVLQVG